MKIEIQIQKNGTNTIYEYINNELKNTPKKAYFFCGCVKEAGFNILEESIIDLKTKVIFALGIDKKNTTKNMLELLLKYADEVYVYNNNDVFEFDSNTIVFEYAEKAIMLTTNSNISEGGLKDNTSFYTIIQYDLTKKEEKDEYKENTKKLLTYISENGFLKLNKELVEKLLDEKQIFSIKQYIHSVKSISELLEERKEASKSIEPEEKHDEEDDILGGNGVIPKIDLSDVLVDDLEIEFPEEVETKKEEKVKAPSKLNGKESIQKDEEIIYDNDTLKDDGIDGEKLNNIAYEETEEIDKENELYDEELANINFDENSTLDIENLLFSKSDLKLNTNSRKSDLKGKTNSNDKKEDEIVQTKKLDLNNISNLLIELPEKSTKEQEAICIKIPNYIKDMIPNFFEMNENVKSVEINGVMSKVRDIEIEIVDVKENKKYVDRQAKIINKNAQTYTTITSDTLKNVTYKDKDIVRIIKLSTEVYHIEVISQEIQEYKLWSKLCTQTMKSTSRKYGMM